MHGLSGRLPDGVDRVRWIGHCRFAGYAPGRMVDYFRRRTRLITRQLRIALIGTRGVPANYGGFETCAQEVAVGLVERGHDVTVYCRKGNAAGDPQEFRGVKLRYATHIEQKAMGTLSHTLLSTIDALRQGFDVLFYFNAANAPAAFLARLMGRTPVLINVDGLEWKRRKWGRVGRTYYQASEWLSTKIAHRIIADSLAIQSYYQARWRTPSSFAAYGAHVAGSVKPEVLSQYGLETNGYLLTVGRLEPENNADLIVRAFERVETEKQLVVVGGVNYRSDYVRKLQSTTDPRIRFLGGVYTPGHIQEIYCGAYAYVHGHEVGGTNPALLQALGHGNCVLALDVPFNAEVIADAGIMFKNDPDALAERMRDVLADPVLVDGMRDRAKERMLDNYQWQYVVEAYEALARRAVDGCFRGKPVSDTLHLDIAMRHAGLAQADR